MTRGLIVLNAALFLFELSLGPSLRGFVFDYGFVPLRLTHSLSGGEPVVGPALTVLSSMFLHGGWAHLLGNMWYLWIFGDNVEDRFGHAGFLLFYLASGAIATGAHWLANGGSPVPTVGASGAIAGVLGAYLVAFPRARVLTLVPMFVVVQLVTLPAVLVLGLWFVFQFMIGALSLGAAAGGGVAWWAHVGGFAFGALAMSALGRPRAPREWRGA